MPNDDGSRRTGERPRFLALLAEYSLAAARLRGAAAVRRPRPRWTGDRPLDVAMLSAYPPGHYGTMSRLTGWVPHLEARGARVRVLHPSSDEEYAAFRAGGIEAEYAFQRAALGNGMKNIRAAAKADVVFLHRGLFPFGPWQRPTFERLLARLNPSLVYDFYDSIHVLRRRAHEGARSRAARRLNPPDLVESLISTAAAVTVSNGFLAAFAREHHERVHTLPMVLAASTFEVKEHRPVSTLVLGWMGGTGNISRLLAVAPALARAAKEVSFRLRVVSGASIEIPGVEVESHTHPWTPESDRRDALTFDVGILPMFDDEEDRGKSPLKLLQYAAAGLPIVASPVAVDPDHFVHGESILYAATEDEWVEQIVRLAKDPGLRASLGAAARGVLETRYSYKAHADDFHALLRGVATGTAS